MAEPFYIEPGQKIWGVNFDFTSFFRKDFRKECEKHTTDSELRKSGFKKIGERRYVKKFGKILELRIKILSEGGKFYDWILNEEEFQKMFDELKGIKTYLDDTSEKLHSQILPTKKKGVYRFPEEYYREENLAIDTFYEMRKEFIKKYKDFFAILIPDRIPKPYPSLLYFDR